MKAYVNYEKSEAFTGEFEQLIPGGNVCIIKKVEVKETNYGHLMRIAFDIAEGEHKGFYKRQFDRKKEGNSDAKWPGMYYQTIKPESMQYFKGFMSSIEGSNNGFKWDWDENKLIGKVFGGVFGEEEFVDNHGSIKKAVKCMRTTTVENIRNGKFTIPEIKKMKNNTYSDNNGFTPMDDDELPF